MSDMILFHPGWLKQEITSALMSMVNTHQVPDEQKLSLQKLADAIKTSDAIKSGDENGRPGTTKAR